MNERKLIGVFATEIASRVQVNLYKELQKVAKEKGYNLVLFSGTYEKSDAKDTALITKNLYELAEYKEFSAFVIHAQSIGNYQLIDYVINIGKKKNIPVFVYDCENLGIDKSDGVFTINPDYINGFRNCVKHLIECHKCKNIFMLGGIKDNKYSEDRIAVYRQEMESHGLPVTEGMIGYGDFWEIPAEKAVREFINSDLPTPEAICCANDAMAITAVRVLNKLGYKVPEDILVTGFDGIEDGKYYSPSISTCEPRLDKVAHFIFSVIDKECNETEYMISLDFHQGESCCGLDYDSYSYREEVTHLLRSVRQNSWQNHMLSAMQVSLIDCEDIPVSAGFMKGTLDFFKNYAHLFCIREDIEYLSDYTTPFDKMRVHLNENFLPDKDYGSFSINEGIPGFEDFMAGVKPDEVIFISLIHCAEKMYGYNIIRTTELISNEMKLLEQLCENFTYIIEAILRNRQLKIANQKLSEMYERMSEIYIRDTLTGLYNRHGYYQNFNEYISRNDLKDGFVHIISIDMDNMKYINDNFGHIEGDVAIKAVSKALTDCFSEPCICARFGGDEFAVALFTEQEKEPALEKISAKLNYYLKTVPLLEGKEYPVGVSVGQAVAKIADVSGFEGLEKIADDSMYENKRQRKTDAIKDLLGL